MKVLTLRRFPETPDGIFGALFTEDGFPFCPTLELHWKDNRPKESAIPIGEYVCLRIISPRFKYEVYELQNVPNRTNVEIHAGNSICDIEGCLLLGRAYGVVDSKIGLIHGVQESKVTLERFMATMKNDPSFKLVIQNVS